MQKYGVNELRKMFLEFFESKGHLAMKSFHWCLIMIESASYQFWYGTA